MTRFRLSSLAVVFASSVPMSLAAQQEATILLVTDAALVDAWQPFANWKTQIGKATSIVTVDGIREHYEAESVHEQIRLCVRDHIENKGTRWVVLGGDSLRDGAGLVPGGHTTVHRQERRGIPTDIVYLSPTNWDADGDGVYGEWRDDADAITYPDGTVGLGRVPVRTATDVAAFTDKVIAYESAYPEGEFAKEMVYTCTDSPAYPKVRKSWDAHVSKVWDGQVGRFFSQETPWDEPGQPGSYPLSAENLVSLMNGKTVSKLHIHGHGHLPLWVLEKSRFTREHVAELEHGGAYPLITTVSCNTGEYDSAQDPSIVEAMIRRPNGGSVAIVAPIRTGKPHFHKRSDFRLMVQEGKLDGTTHTMTRYWTQGLGHGKTTGEALMLAKAAMVDDARKTAGYHLCICELNLLGDPTLGMRAMTPTTPKVTAPKSLSAGASEVVIETSAPGATVCVWQRGGVYDVREADESGRVAFAVTLQQGDPVSYGVAGAGLNAVVGEIAVDGAK